MDLENTKRSKRKETAVKGAVFLALGILVVVGMYWRENLERASWASSRLIRDTAILQEIVVLVKENLRPLPLSDQKRKRIVQNLLDKGTRALSRMDQNRTFVPEEGANLLNALKDDLTGIRRESDLSSQSSRLSSYIVHFDSNLATFWQKEFDFQRTIKSQMKLLNMIEGGIFFIAMLAVGNTLFQRRHLFRNFTLLSEFYRARSEMTAALRKLSDLDKIFEELCRVVVVHTTAPLAMVLEVEDASIAAAKGEMISRLGGRDWILVPDEPLGRNIVDLLIHAGNGLMDLTQDDLSFPQKDLFLRHHLRFFSKFPLYENGKAIAFFIGFFSHKEDFSQPVQELFFTLTNETSSALDHLKNESMRQKTENKNVLLKNIFQSLAEINESIARFPDPGTLFDSVCRSLLKTGVLKHVLIGIYNPQSGNFTIRKIQGISRKVAEDIFYFDNPVYLGERNAVEEVFRTGKPILLDYSSGKAKEIPEDDAAGLMGVKSIGFYPIFRNGMAPYGVFASFSMEDDIFDADLQELTHRVVQSITFGLKNWDLELVRKEQEEKSIHMSFHDPLTDLPNRRLFYDRLVQILKQSSRMDSLFGIGILDLNGFKNINDTFGHLEGDRLLMEVAERMKKYIRSVDVLARLGGDEFGFVFFGLSSEYEIIFKRIIDKTFDKPFVLGEREVRVSGSLGIALFRDAKMGPDDLIALADRTMYEVKSRGGGYKAVLSHS
ncbi:MAG: sensor domain-containing diguanylate cyclase [Nitrospiraceae bacterium]|nr:sensor domain-containing diguanylate cyclase [Nitrospiraceae bacterium]